MLTATFFLQKEILIVSKMCFFHFLCQSFTLANNFFQGGPKTNWTLSRRLFDTRTNSFFNEKLEKVEFKIGVNV